MLNSHLLLAIVLTSVIVLITKPILFKYRLQYLAKERNHNVTEMRLSWLACKIIRLLRAVSALMKPAW